MRKKIANWWRFTAERFPLVSHLTMIALFVGGHFVFFITTDQSVQPLNVLMVFSAILIFFYKMRLYDEIKDYELDIIINPTRPLPRGLLTLVEVKWGIVVCIALEVLLFSFLGIKALLVMVGAILYSLLMYKEFFIGKYIRLHLTTYALAHTIVTVPMGLAIFTAFMGEYPWLVSNKYLYFAFCNWFVFNIFEFGRKTFATDEERDQVESYSKVFGRYGAVILVGLMSVMALVLMKSFQSFSLAIQYFWAGSLLMIGLTYAWKNKKQFANIYRNFSSVYIILFYITFVVQGLLEST